MIICQIESKEPMSIYIVTRLSIPFRVPQGSIIELLLFGLFLVDFFFIVDAIGIAS